MEIRIKAKECCGGICDIDDAKDGNKPCHCEEDGDHNNCCHVEWDDD